MADTLRMPARTAQVTEEQQLVRARVNTAHRVSEALDSGFWRRWSVLVEVAGVVVVMSAVAWLLDASPRVSVVLVMIAVALNYSHGRQTVRPGLPRAEQIIRDTTVPFTIAGVGVVVGVIDESSLMAALLLSVAGGGVTLAGAAFRSIVPIRQRVVLVGSAGDVAEYVAQYAENPRLDVVGSLVTSVQPAPVERGGRRQAPDNTTEIAEALTTYRPDMVVAIPGAGVSEAHLRQLTWAMEGTGACLAVETGFQSIAPHRIQPTLFGGHHLLQVTSSRAPRWMRAAKMLSDRVLGALLLLLVAPLLLALGAAVRITSPGPAFFRQTRVGRNGQSFTMIKLRTMCCTAEADKSYLSGSDGNGLLFKQKDDPRVTRLGRVLRKYSLDELPQLINVVRGDMSLIGPRPALPEEVAQYTAMERRRLAVRPGMTGAWQVSGRSTLDRDESMRLDTAYVDNFRVTDDMLILVRTVDAVVRPRGAW